MDEDLNVDPSYQKGFNQGYILAEHAPVVAKLVVNAECPQTSIFRASKLAGSN
jgi:hypothetical protein